MMAGSSFRVHSNLPDSIIQKRFLSIIFNRTFTGVYVIFMIIMCIFLKDVFRKTDEEYFFRQEFCREIRQIPIDDPYEF